MTRALQAAALLAVFVWLTVWSAVEVAPLLGWTWSQVVATLWLALLLIGALRGKK